MNTKHRGANGFQLKLLALITMTMDHIAVYLPGAPDWFHYAGRLAAPIFLYLCMEGFFYTHSRTRHLARMYILSSLMKAGSLALCLTLPRGTGLTNDIFSTMFVSCWIVQGMELIRSPEGRRKRQGMLMLAGTAAATAAFLLVYSNFERVPLNLLRLVNILLPNPISCEGGFVIVILGVLLPPPQPAGHCAFAGGTERGLSAGAAAGAAQCDLCAVHFRGSDPDPAVQRDTRCAPLQVPVLSVLSGTRLHPVQRRMAGGKPSFPIKS